MGQDSHRHAPAACPRCGRTLREPTVWSSAWRCDWHGEVHPLLPAFSPSRDGLDGVDPGSGFGSAPPAATASFGKHDFPLWNVDSPDRAVFAGEVKGLWLWIVLWPDTAGALLIEPIGLRDLRDPGPKDLDLPFGAASPRLTAG